MQMQVQAGETVTYLQVQPNRRPTYLFIKRTMDIVASAAALIVASPILLLVAIAIKLEDPKGKVLYTQARTGKAGVSFSIYKFRSMFSNADEIKALLMDLNEMDGPVFKIRNDPRITKVGKFIRKTSIDEIPQFLNVLKGELSLVGPRPLPVREAQACNEFQRQRELVRPGITCTWQASGRNNISFERWMEMDVEYIRTQSVRTDILLLLKTIPAVFMARGAA